MKLTSKGTYALRALLDLVHNSNGSPVRIKDISERQGISQYYLEQLFTRLRRSGVVDSVRGPGGGYVLAGAPSSVTVGQVFSSVGELFSYNLKKETAEGVSLTQESAATGRFFGEIDSAITDKLATTLDQLG